MAVVENEVQLEKFLKSMFFFSFGTNLLGLFNNLRRLCECIVRDQLPKLKAIVMYTGDVPEKVRAGNANAAAPVYSWKEFVAFHAKTPAGQVSSIVACRAV